MALREAEVNGWKIRVFASQPDELRCTITRGEEPPRHGSSPMVVSEDDRDRIADEMVKAAAAYVARVLA